MFSSSEKGSGESELGLGLRQGLGPEVGVFIQAIEGRKPRKWS